MNNILEKLITSKVSRFANDFTYNSKELFINKEGKEVEEKEMVYHPGEFGTYREEIVKSLLKSILPQKFGISSGFVITKNGNISTQCDIIIYDTQNCPRFESEESQIFFPIECVVAVGEVKSDIRGVEELKQILEKLQDIKKLRDEVNPNSEFIYRNKNVISVVDMEQCPEDSIVTFLICNRIKPQNKENVIIDVYNSNIEQHNKHNFILSLNDGLYLYHYLNHICYSPIFDGNVCDNIFISKNSDDDYSHIITFLNYLYIALSNNSIFRLNISDYLLNQEISYHLCTKKDNQ